MTASLLSTSMPRQAESRSALGAGWLIRHKTLTSGRRLGRPGVGRSNHVERSPDERASPQPPRLFTGLANHLSSPQPTKFPRQGPTSRAMPVPSLFVTGSWRMSDSSTGHPTRQPNPGSDPADRWSRAFGKRGDETQFGAPPALSRHLDTEGSQMRTRTAREGSVVPAPLVTQRRVGT